jgi:hypothetical protein
VSAADLTMLELGLTMLEQGWAARRQRPTSF